MLTMTDDLERQVADNPNSVSDGMGIYRERLGDDLERQVAEALEPIRPHFDQIEIDDGLPILTPWQSKQIAPRIAAALRATALKAQALQYWGRFDEDEAHSAGLAALKGEAEHE